MTRALFRCGGGDVSLPDRRLVLVDRKDGGNLIVTPFRDVWDRGQLSPEELTRWSFLVAATGRAMLETLPQLDGGCVNYWDAGNWALNIEADPPGVRKSGALHRKVHYHLLGRSRDATSPSLRWGEAPSFPDYPDRHEWAAEHHRLAPDECHDLVTSIEDLLLHRYDMAREELVPWIACEVCGYPMPMEAGTDAPICGECGSAG